MLKSRQTVRLYFRAQLFATLVLFPTALLYPQYYTVFFVGATLPILETCWLIIWDAQLEANNYLMALCFGLLTGCIAAFGLTRHSTGVYATFFEGVALAVTGITLLLASLKLGDAAVEMIGALSLALSSYDFGFILNPDWRTLNSWVPSLLCTAAFLKIGVSNESDHRKLWT